MSGFDQGCAVKRELVDSYVQAVAAYTRVAALLCDTADVLVMDEYLALHHVVDNARIFAEKAFKALAQHEAEHGC